MRKTKTMHIAVLSGGPSSEHEVSLESGRKVREALRDTYEVTDVLIDREGRWSIPPSDLSSFADCAFIALHGRYGEDGAVQRELERHGIPYTGSDPLASALGMNKFLSLRVFREAGMHVPHTRLVTSAAWRKNPVGMIEEVVRYFHAPVVVKPNREGSSVGVSIVKNTKELASALGDCFSFSRDVLVQEYIEGREFTCGVLDHGWGESAYALLPTEIIPRVSHFFDYRAKYEVGGSLEITPPENLPKERIKEIRDAARRAHWLIGASGFSRTDVIMDKKGMIYVIEINTIPGLTGESLLPKAAAESGISFSDLVRRIVQAAFFRSRKKFEW